MATQARYKGQRITLPRLSNTYAALQEAFQYPFENPVASGCYTVTQASTNMNEIQAFEPITAPLNYISNSPLATAMFSRYDEFRIRKINIAFTSQVLNPTNAARSDVWIWWCPNHYEEDEDVKISETFDTVTDFSEAARVQHVRVEPGKSFSVEFVPQVVMVDQSVILGGTVIDQHGDRQMPWLRTTATNRDQTMLRAPIVYFRKPFAAGSAIPPQYYQVVCTAIVEFRNLNDDN